MINAKQKLEGTVVVGKPSATVELLDVYGGYTLRVSDPNGTQEFTLKTLKGAVEGNPGSIRLVLEDGTDIPIMQDGKIKASDLPDATEDKKGAMTPEDKKSLNRLAAREDVTQCFEDAGSDTLFWDGYTEGLECYDGYLYKVSDATPTYEELSKDITATLKDSHSDGIYDWPIYIMNNTSDYCSIGDKGVYAYVIYEGNTLGKSPGTYFGPDVRAIKVTDYTGFKKKVLREESLPFGIDNTPTADSENLVTSGGVRKALEDVGVGETGVEAGTYGGFDAEYNGSGAVYEHYNIPNIKVDKYGRVTEASNSVLPKASAESDGYIGAEDYEKIGYIPSFFNPITNTNYVVIKAGKTTVAYNNHSASIGIYDAAGISDLPVPLRVVAQGEYTDSSGRTWVIPLDWKAEKIATKGTYLTCDIYVSIPEPIEYDINVKIYANYELAGLM